MQFGFIFLKFGKIGLFLTFFTATSKLRKIFTTMFELVSGLIN